jgi:hypothetical protein
VGVVVFIVASLENGFSFAYGELLLIVNSLIGEDLM